MIVVLFMFIGLCGGVVGALCCAAWYGAALLFGFAPPTEEQFSGAVVLFASASALGSAALASVALIMSNT